MSREFSNASLGLFPAGLETDLLRGDADVPEAQQLAALCRDTGLTGEAIDGHQRHYYAGERFLDLINFMGCSPHIQFDSDTDSDRFTHIILHLTERPTLYHGDYTRPAFCKRCGKPNKSWQNNADLDVLQLTCDHCSQRAPLADYDWRRSAGVSRLLIEITEIFPKEAQPQPGLLHVLEQNTGYQWDYFYF